jgi:hypothetical protein
MLIIIIIIIKGWVYMSMPIFTRRVYQGKKTYNTGKIAPFFKSTLLLSLLLL